MLLEELVERSIFHALREEIVERGYLPDIENYDIENPDLVIAAEESKRYKDDLKGIRDTKGFAIEIFNYANNQSYGEKSSPRMVIKNDSFVAGNIGLDPTGKKVRNPDGTYKIIKEVDMVSDYYFSIYLVASTTRSMRELHDIMVTVMPRRGYLKYYTDNILRPHSNLLIQYLSSADVSFLAEGIMEKVYKYFIPDVHETDGRVIQDNIPEIKNIDVNKDNGEIIINVNNGK